MYELAVNFGILTQSFEFYGYEFLLDYRFSEELAFVRKIMKRSALSLEASSKEILKMSRDPNIFDCQLKKTLKMTISRRKNPQTNHQRGESHQTSSSRIGGNLNRITEFHQNAKIRFFQSKVLFYTFKRPSLLISALTPSSTNLDMQRLEFIGDTCIELIALCTARRFAIRMKRRLTPELYSGIKTIVLSTEGLSTLCAYHEIYKYIIHSNIHSDQIIQIDQYVHQRDYEKQGRLLWWKNEKRAPKILADVLEAICGAILVDGGWKALNRVFGRLAGPFVFFGTKFFNEIGRNVVGDITEYYSKMGVECLFQTGKKRTAVVLRRIGLPDEVLIEVISENKLAGKRKAAIELLLLHRKRGQSAENSKEKSFEEDSKLQRYF